MLKEIYENYYHPQFYYKINGKSIELDIFLPKEKIVFEYQGENHYYDIYSMGIYWQKKQRDEEKKKICKEKNITLIEIPYWWDGKISTLEATIHKQRKDLIPIKIDGE